MYPFSTQNRKDYNNLLSVYLDAVFYPQLRELDFRCVEVECFIYELTKPEFWSEACQLHFNDDRVVKVTEL